MQLIPSNRLDRDMGGHILVIDQGTTSTRAIVFDERARPLASAQMEFPQIYPRPGWIEHDPEDLWNTTLSTAREAIAKAGGPQKAMVLPHTLKASWDRGYRLNLGQCEALAAV